MYVAYRITPETVPNKGILYVNHEQHLRSGHLGHALVEYRKNCILSFYSNCSGTRNQYHPGHNGFGWVEYKRSTDGGAHWSAPTVLPYAWDSFLNQPYTISCEKAVSTKENEIVLFCLRNTNPNGWEPYLEPVVLRSTDGGESWSGPMVMCDKKGRVYDAFVKDGIIYALMVVGHCVATDKPEDGYFLYQSEDGGKSFSLVSAVPYTPGSFYGNLSLLDDGGLICYEYVMKDEYHLAYHISYDMGLHWTTSGQSYVAKRIRNPQVAKVKGGYILHGRAGCETPELPPHFVLYTSKNGLDWDEGTYLCAIEAQSAYYSNNLVLDRPDGSQRVLIQASVPYDDGRVNIAHWFLDID